MFVEKQKQALAYDIEPSRIKKRVKGNITLSYLEGFDLIETANKIFGHGNWSYSTTSLAQVSQETNANQNTVICYKALIRLVVYSQDHNKNVSKEDVGYGTGIAKTLAEAHEGAGKEAVTDALKRAMRSFGNQFGNSLYDKSRNHLTTTTAPTQLPTQHQAPTQNPNHLPHSPYEFSSLTNLGLQVLEQGNNYIVMGDDIFNKKDSIKACDFRWDATHKVWYLPREQQAA